MKKRLVPILLVAGITALSGCANNANDVRNDIRTTDVRDNVRNNVDFRDNNRLTVSERAARNVEGLKEVDRAHVIMRGNDAYVAVRLNNRDGRTGTLGTGNNGTNGTTGINSANIGNTHINNGTNGTTGTTGVGNNFGTTGADGTTGTTGTAGLNGTTVGPNGTTGMTNTGGNKTGTYSRVDTAFEQSVADQVRKANRNVHKVYVSTDANFFNRMTTYSNDIQSGRNRDGLLRNFTDTMGGFFNNR
jgi:predicted small secreted protein